ncbi:MAG: hypothetical protein K0S21_1380 [Rhizobiaceae bacterium]|nr:hypothetical protein [Rhizobiaceae bacterium]
MADQIEFLRLVSDAVADDWIGLTLAADFDLREMGMLYYVAASSQRLGDALHRLERYARLGNEALVVQIRKGSVCRIGLSYTGVPRHLDRHQMELLSLAFLRLCRQLAGQKVMPLAASFIHHRSGDMREVRRHFGDAVEFGASADEICLDPALLDLGVASQDPFLNELMLRSCEEAIAGRSSNLSPFRRDLAFRYLRERNLPVSQIAWLLGFHGPSAFSHACRRWTGKSPVEYRRDHPTSSATPD